MSQRYRGRSRGRGYSFRHGYEQTMPRNLHQRPHSAYNYNQQRSSSANKVNVSLQETLLQSLNASHPRPVPFSDLKKAVAVKFTKSDINRELYSMLKNGMVQKQEGHPVMWNLLQKGRSLCSESLNTSSAANFRNRGCQSAREKAVHHSSSSSVGMFPDPSYKQSNKLWGSLETNSPPVTTEATNRLPVNLQPTMETKSVNQTHSNPGLFPHSATARNSTENTVSVGSSAFIPKGMNLSENVPVSVSDVTESVMSDEPVKDDSKSSSDEDASMSDDELPPLIERDTLLVTKTTEQKESDSSTSSTADLSSHSSIIKTALENPLKRSVLETKLLNALSPSNPTSISSLLQIFKNVYEKLQLNQALYAMQGKGLVRRSEDNPPKWILESKGKVLHAETDSDPTNMDADALGKRPLPAQYVKQLERVCLADEDHQHGNVSSERHTPYYPLSDTRSHSYVPPRKIARLCNVNELKDDFEMSDIASSSSKNPVSQIMEYAQAQKLSIDFQFTVKGPDHKRRFSAIVKLGSDVFPAVEGSSKKDAKTKASECVLSILKQSTASATHSSSLPTPPSHASAEQQRVVIPLNIGASSSKNAISLVNEYAQANNMKIEFHCDSYGPDHRKSFRTILAIGSNVFQPVEGPSKKDSKLKAAEAALIVLQNSGKIATSNTSMQQASGEVIVKTFHDRVAMLVNQKFQSLLSELPDTVVGRKILAGFVMSRTTKTEMGEENQWSVISIGSGNRCVAGDKLSMKGDTVNDCHAEIIARRGLMRFLYQQIMEHKEDIDDEDNVLIRIDGGKRFSVKPGVKFHLYISTAPCGDSALFAKSDLRDDETMLEDEGERRHHPLFENKKQGILRTKVENGEGCIPIDEDANVPTWDGLLRGERLRTMSCSDKIAKWNYLGLQGALLSHFIKPFYMSSLTLGMLYHHGHLTRAVCCRVEKYLNLLPQESIPPAYEVHHPEVAKVSGEDPSRDTGKMKTREYSLNWCIGDERAEVLDGTKGRCEARYGCINPVSQVSKSSLYAEFNRISDQQFSSYVKAKEAIKDYKQASEVMKRAFENAQCGKWMSKPSEVEEF